MNILGENEAIRLHIYHLLKLFFHEKAEHFSAQTEVKNGVVTITLSLENKKSTASSKIDLALHKTNNRGEKAALGKAFFATSRDFTTYIPPYGLLFGVRPVKVPLFYREIGKTKEETKEILEKEFFVSEEKATLLMHLCEKELLFQQSLSENKAMLYLSIPFCPSRCKYCSFISSAAPKHLSLIPQYVSLMNKELSATAKLLKEKGRKISAIYMGGGTPGILSPEQMGMILNTVKKEFDLSDLGEFTVEMGRPDTITKEKLSVLSEMGVNRISINPQSTKDETLKRIGRNHSAEDFYNAMELAKEFSFDSINCDLIAGLQGESPKDFLTSLENVLSLSPQEVTLHALCQKRSAENQENKNFTALWQETMSLAHKNCINHGLEPYYLYRQKNAISDLENTGFAKKGSLGVYNLAMMEDLCDIFAVGAGGIGKLLPKNTGEKIHRFPGFKYPFEYLSSPEKIWERLDEIKTLL